MTFFWPWVRSYLQQDGLGEPVDGVAWLSLWPVVMLRIVVTLVSLWLVLRVVGRLNSSLVAIGHDFHLTDRPEVSRGPENNPVVMLRIVVTLVSLWLVFRVVGRLKSSLQAISHDFHLPYRPEVSRGPENNPDCAQGAPSLVSTGQTGLGRQVLREVGKLVSEIPKLIRHPEPDQDFVVSKFWLEDYVPRCTPTARYTRSFLYPSILMGLFVFVSFAHSGLDMARGSLVRECYSWSFYGSLAALLWLACMVLDATIWSVKLVGKIGMEPASQWPGGLIKDRMSAIGWTDVATGPNAVKNRALADLIDLEFIQRRTQAVLPLVYAPFGVLALFVVSQVIGEELCPPTVALLSAEVVICVMLAVCVVVLRTAAERARGYALELLADAASRALTAKGARPSAGMKGRPTIGAPTFEQLQGVITRISAMRSGAFAGYLQQPLVKAFVLPLSAYVVPLLYTLVTAR